MTRCSVARPALCGTLWQSNDPSSDFAPSFNCRLLHVPAFPYLADQDCAMAVGSTNLRCQSTRSRLEGQKETRMKKLVGKVVIPASLVAASLGLSMGSTTSDAGIT